MANEVERQEFIFGQAAQITRLEVIAERYRKALELFSCEDSRIEGVPHIRGRCCVAREALLTSKPEPVAQGHDGNCVPVRTPDDGWKCDCGYAPVAPVVKTDDLRHLATELLNRIAWEAEHENNHQTVGIQEACKQLQEELEKEAPVVPVRKWEAEEDKP